MPTQKLICKMQLRPVAILTTMFVCSVSLVAGLANACGQIGVSVPEQFTIQKVADNDLAPNIFCMATDSQGAVYVSGPGYIRKLVDRDNDGKFDDYVLFSDVPNSGAQGMWFGDGRMLFAGDDGIWEVVESVASKKMQIKTGSEHLAHAIRQGPDGWLYFLAGNATPILKEYFSGPRSPVKHPRAGFLMRVSPDWKTKEIVAHGFRNAYDFDFNRSGEIFVFDSDGERDISLPWYRPTRLLQMRPGDDAGWVSAGWKRPGFDLDMPTVIGELGRGSPTGVQCYPTTTSTDTFAKPFPSEFDDAIFVADWTFGRVNVFKRSPQSGKYDHGTDFAISDGQFGFAVTDLVIGSDGSLLVSVGGRGTAGGVYRITYTGAPNQNAVARSSAVPARFRMPLVKRAAWDQEEAREVLKLASNVDDDDSGVALESLIGRAGEAWEMNSELKTLFAPMLRNNLATFDPVRTKLVWRIAMELPPKFVNTISQSGLSPESELVLRLAAANEDEERAMVIADVCLQLSTAESAVKRMVFCRLGQLAMGGCGARRCPEMFKGYTAKNGVRLAADNQRLAAAQLASAIRLAVEKNDQAGAEEIGRLVAMMQVSSESLVAVMVDQINEQTSPVDDIHWLNCVAVCGATFDTKAASKIANSIANIDLKIALARLPTDKNWIPRMRQLTKQLFAGTADIATEVQQLIAGRAGQVFLFHEMPADLKKIVSRDFVTAVTRESEKTGTMDDVTQNQLHVVAFDSSPQSTQLLRQMAEYNHLQDAAILALAMQPRAEDRHWYKVGLASRDATITKYSAIALRKITRGANEQELLVAFKVARRLGWSKPDVSLRDHVVRLMEHQTGKRLGYQFGQPELDQSNSINQWGKYLEGEFPDGFSGLFPVGKEIALSERLARVEWKNGDSERGRQLYRELKCAQCHDGGSRLGPRLDGVTRRFGREDLFRAIVTPSDQIPDRYRATIVETVDGMFYTGTVIYESVDGITLQDTSGMTVRINHADIEAKKKSDRSLMPAGLLDNLKPDQWADLYAYVRGL